VPDVAACNILAEKPLVVHGVSRARVATISATWWSAYGPLKRLSISHCSDGLRWCGAVLRWGTWNGWGRQSRLHCGHRESKGTLPITRWAQYP